MQTSSTRAFPGQDVCSPRCERPEGYNTATVRSTLGSLPPSFEKSHHLVIFFFNRQARPPSGRRRRLPLDLMKKRRKRFRYPDGRTAEPHPGRRGGDDEDDAPQTASRGAPATVGSVGR